MTLKGSFKFSLEAGFSREEGGPEKNLKLPLRVIAQQTNTLKDTETDTQPITRMSAMTYELSASVRDFMTDPQMKKALRAREDRYLANIAWLDQDLAEKLHLANIAWLDQDLAEKLHLANIAWLDQDLAEKMEYETATKVQKDARQPKLWHCGNGPLDGGTQQQLGNYNCGTENNFAWICHGTENEEWTKKPGTSNKQFKRFNSLAQEGDILNLHCSHSSIGGITHRGIFTGEIKATGDPGISHICVYEWIPLEAVMKGTGARKTLYEVTRTTKEGKPTKNYQNYERVVRDIFSS